MQCHHLLNSYFLNVLLSCDVKHENDKMCQKKLPLTEEANNGYPVTYLAASEYLVPDNGVLKAEKIGTNMDFNKEFKL